MKLNKNPGIILLSVWLIASGLFTVLRISFTGSGVVLAILAIAAGVVILLQGKSLPARIGIILLSIWLIIGGLLSLLHTGFPGSGIALAVLAIAAGVLILLSR